MYYDVTGIVLSGGKSMRMGVNKSFLTLGGKTFIERITDLMKTLFDKVILISNTPDEYMFLNIPVCKDIYKDKGPLAGIHSGLKNSSTLRNFIISCDIPLMTKEMIEYIVNFKTEKLLTICKAHGFLQPFAGLYNKSLLKDIENIINRNSDFVNHTNELSRKQCEIMSFIKSIETEILDPEIVNGFSENIFMNINTPEEFDKLNKIFC